jgi:rhamnose transport system permease protein
LNYELEIITIVVLGGVSMYGGRGTMAGVILALFLVGMLRYGLSLKNVPANMILIIIGLILISSAIIPNVVYGLRKRSEFRKEI